MRLREGGNAPNFEVIDVASGNPIRLSEFKGHRTLISFHRYAACPFCNLHIHELSQAYANFKNRDLKILAIFCSLPDRVAQQYASREVPFQIAADPNVAAYDAFGIEKSTLGMMASFVHPRGITAILKGFFPGKIDGDVRWLPADFLLSPEQQIKRAYYSTNITQHLSIAEIERFAASE